MKRIIFIMVLILSFCGCSKEIWVTPQEVAERYSEDFFVAAKTEETEMDISKNRMSISFDVKNPKEISGLKVELSGEHAKVIYEGMEQSINTKNLPEKAPFLLVSYFFECLADAEKFSLSIEGDNIIAKNEDFTAVLSKENFSVVKAVFPQYDAEFFFSEWSFSSAE